MSSGRDWGVLVVWCVAVFAVAVAVVLVARSAPCGERGCFGGLCMTSAACVSGCACINNRCS